MRTLSISLVLLALSGCGAPRPASIDRGTPPDAGARSAGLPRAGVEDSRVHVTSDTLTGSVTGIAPGHTATVILGNDRFLASRVVAAGQPYVFSGLPSDTYFLAIEIDGHVAPRAREVVVSAVPGASVPAASLDFSTAPLPGGSFSFHWEEDPSRAGQEQTAYVDAPPVVVVLGQPVPVPDVAAGQALAHDYNVVLSDERVPWNQEHAYRLLETMKSIPQSTRDPYGPPAGPPSKWILTDDTLPGDISVTYAPSGDVVTLSTAALVYATPTLVSLDGQRGTFFSKRLHHALVDYVTRGGQALGAVEKILGDRFGCTTVIPDYTLLTGPTTGEDASSFQPFHPGELVTLINVFEEMPSGYHAVPGLAYLVRRKDGMPNPLYGAPAVAWAWPEAFPGGSYIEFMDAAFNADADQVHRLILHEKTHFMWGYLLSDEIKNDWITIGGWYPDPTDPDGWSTTKTTEFVSAYAHKKSPNEDLAESVAYFVLDPGALQSRAMDKYAFVRDRIMQGSLYVSELPPALTFQVLDLDPDYTFPGKIRRVDIQVDGAPESDKVATVEIELHTLNNVFAGASSARLRLFSEIGTYADLWLAPTNAAGSILRGQVTLSRYAKSGFWRTDQIVITDAEGNLRLEGAEDYGWKLYVNNAHEDLAPPKYTPGSLALTLTDDVVVEGGVSHPVQRLRASFHVDEDVAMAPGWPVTVNLSDPSANTYATAQEGAVDPSTGLATVDFLITSFRPSGAYGVPYLMMFDAAGNKGEQYFSASPAHQPLVSISVVTQDADTVAPEVSLNDDPALGVHGIQVSAAPTHPAAPDGETRVTIKYQARDDRSGLGIVSYRLLDPQGISHFDYHYHPNFYTMFFAGDAAAWTEYALEIVLPAGSAPGTWGLSELVLHDKVDNLRSYDFAETVQFDLAP